MALKGQRFETIEEQNAYLKHWRARGRLRASMAPSAARCRPCSKKSGPTCRACQRCPWLISATSSGTVCDDGCVRVAHCSYAPRPAAIGSKVLVRIFERRLEI